LLEAIIVKAVENLAWQMQIGVKHITQCHVRELCEHWEPILYFKEENVREDNGWKA
jgi:hypothetical protein